MNDVGGLAHPLRAGTLSGSGLAFRHARRPPPSPPRGAAGGAGVSAGAEALHSATGTSGLLPPAARRGNPGRTGDVVRRRCSCGSSPHHRYAPGSGACGVQRLSTLVDSSWKETSAGPPLAGPYLQLGSRHAASGRFEQAPAVLPGRISVSTAMNPTVAPRPAPRAVRCTRGRRQGPGRPPAGRAADRRHLQCRGRCRNARSDPTAPASPGSLAPACCESACPHPDTLEHDLDLG